MPTKTNQVQTIIDILKDVPEYRIFDQNHFEDEIQNDKTLSQTWNNIFDNIPIVIGDVIINDTDIDTRISKTVDAQQDYYQSTGLCYIDTNVHKGYVLPITYKELADLIEKQY